MTNNKVHEDFKVQDEANTKIRTLYLAPTYLLLVVSAKAKQIQDS